MNKLTITAGDNNDLVMTRSFDAPRELVFKALTTPELVKRWLLGPPGWEMTECTIDLRVGGKYHYAWKSTRGDGAAMGMGGEYREINKPEKIVSTEKFDQSWYEGEAVGTVTMTEANGKTTVVTTVQYNSKETRDNVLKSPMESGVSAGYDRLEEVLGTL